MQHKSSNVNWVDAYCKCALNNKIWQVFSYVLFLCFFFFSFLAEIVTYLIFNNSFFLFVHITETLRVVSVDSRM